MQIKMDYDDNVEGSNDVVDTGSVIPSTANTTVMTQDNLGANPSPSPSSSADAIASPGTGASPSPGADAGTSTGIPRVVSRSIHIPGALALFVVVDECSLMGSEGDTFSVLDDADMVVCTRSGSQCSPLTPSAAGQALVRVLGDRVTVRVTIASKGTPLLTVENANMGGNEQGKEEEKEGNGVKNTTNPSPGAGAGAGASPGPVAVVRKYSVRSEPFTACILKLILSTLYLRTLNTYSTHLLPTFSLPPSETRFSPPIPSTSLFTRIIPEFSLATALATPNQGVEKFVRRLRQGDIPPPFYVNPPSLTYL